MKNEELLQDAIGMIGDDLINDADRSPRRPSIIRWSAIACACLAVIIGLTAILRGPKTPIEPWIPTGEPWRPVIAEGVSKIDLKASTLEELFFVMLNDGGTNAYKKVYAPNVEMLASAPIPQAEYLPIYRHPNADGNKVALKAFIDEYLPVAKNFFDFSTSEYTIEKHERWDGSIMYSTSLEENKSRLAFVCAGNSLYYYNSSWSSEKRLKINGEFVSILESDTDEDIKAKLSDLISLINQTHGKTYRDVKVVRTYDYSQFTSVYVYLYNAEDCMFPENFKDNPMCSEYVELEFHVSLGEGRYYNWEGEKNEAFLVTLSYNESLMDWNDYYRVKGKARMLSLDEAEELLAKGYVFGGHSCKLCMAEQKKVDFTEYDAVSFEYVHGENGMVVPFYTFYKRLGTSTSDKTGRIQEYAKTYVPAVEIEGLEEYFDLQAKKHK